MKNKNLIRLLKKISDDLYFYLAPAKIPETGVGVFALRDIPKGIELFKDEAAENYSKVEEKQLKKLPLFFRKELKKFCIKEKTYYYVPLHSRDYRSLSDFLNHSLKPNLSNEFISLRKIHKGEELTINYKDIDDGWSEKLK